MNKSMPVLLALLCVSCSRFTPPLISMVRFSPPIDETAVLNTNRGVVFGRFSKGSDFAFGNKVALRLRNEATKDVHLIQCRAEEALYAIAVEPGSYKIEGFLATYADHRPVGGRSFSEPLSFQVQPNSATYVGDFTAYAKLGPMMQRWGVNEWTNNFAVSREEFRAQYPQLSSLPIASAFGEGVEGAK